MVYRKKVLLGDQMKQLPIVLISVSVVIAGVTLGYFLHSTSTAPEETVEAVAPAPEAAVNIAPAPTPKAAPAPETPAPAAEEPAPEPAPPIEAETSSEVQEGINLARVRPDGTSVIAGVAPPGSTINLYRDGMLIGSAMAGNTGDWVIIPEILLEPGSHLLNIEIILPDGEKRIGNMALVVEMPANTEETPLVALVPYVDETAPVEVLQAPDAPAVEEMADSETAAALPPQIIIRSVQALNPNYISVGGKARGGDSVTLTVDGKAAAPVNVDTRGMYSAGQVIAAKANKINLTVSLADASGAEVATARIRLSRGQIKESLGNKSLVVVQKGDALWRIAYQTYGKGIRYVDIYRQNTAQIKDPDLIYPDQIFLVPNQ